ncbi:helix-turn-helix domain-containing protein [Halobacillus litoralis]|uniref:helix-turn-helix domain-containing protein n=1 Tax=Halobacillus litoralis TaxID=45668 RepID=UPI001CD37D46|nr:helix-turn-helix domain-containing protein [Halobacillus litoralis]MCA1024446.1 helix-turn-helix domain-containing protein [Halobacillus litoralis]
MTTDTDELKYEPVDMAGLLEIKESTLRKYCLLLEKEGYVFEKGSLGRRWFHDNDLLVLRRFMILKNGDMSLESAAHAIVSWARQRHITPTVIKNESEDRDMERYFSDYIDQQNDLIQKLLQRLDRQEKYFEERDRWILEQMDTRFEKSRLELDGLKDEEKKQETNFSLWNWIFKKI